MGAWDANPNLPLTAVAGCANCDLLVAKTKLEGRQDLLESKCRLVKEERVLLRSIRVALAGIMRAVGVPCWG